MEEKRLLFLVISVSLLTYTASVWEKLKKVKIIFDPVLKLQVKLRHACLCHVCHHSVPSVSSKIAFIITKSLPAEPFGPGGPGGPGGPPTSQINSESKWTADCYLYTLDCIMFMK